MMMLLIPLFPFLGFLINACIGKRLSKSASGLVAVAVMVASFAVAVTSVIQLAGLPEESRAIVNRIFTWITAGSFTADFTLRLDPLSALMILVITGIGSLIHIYSTSYMHDEPDSEYARYFSYLNLFASFMLILVLGSNFLVMFVGWEGVGLCSYLLIGFYYTKKSAADAGKKAFIVNRIGDFGFVLGVLMLFVKFGSVDFQEIAHQASMLSPEVVFGTVSMATLLLFVGATGKSAQLPLYIWLPDAMEGPTPVSALIHAATMVTAGVYMIGRNAVLFSVAPDTLMVVAVVGAATAFFAGTIGLVQNDIKRVLAYSTVSQLGYMFLAMGVGAYTAGIFHLYTHAFFKALLFLGSGAVIHALSGEQDIRKMGGLKDKLPITYWTFLIGSLAIAGVPGLAGFFSKDEILFKTYAGGHTLLWIVGMLTSLMTATYMFRLVFLTFWGESRTPAAAHDAHGHGHDAHGHGGHGSHLHDAPKPMAFALIALTVGSVLAGYIGLPHALGGSNRLEKWLEPSLTAPHVVASAAEATRSMEPTEAAAPVVTEHGGAGEQAESTSVELGLMGLSSVVALSGIGIAWFFFVADPRRAESVAQSFSGLRTVLLNKYYVDEAYDAAIVQPLKIMSERVLWKVVDANGIDGAVNGAAESVGGLGELLRRLQTGSVRAYAASLLLGAVLVLGYYLSR